MNGKLTLSFTVATFIAAIGVLFFLSDVRNRLADVERRLASDDAGDAKGAKSPPLRGTGARPDPEGDEQIGPLDTKDPVVKLDWLVNKLDEVDTRLYEGIVDLGSDMYELKRNLSRVQTVVKRMLQGLRHSGQFPGFQSDLPPLKKPLTMEQRKAYKDEAAKHGIQVEEGKVTARALLNGAQDKAYPIEYFMTRFPDAGHETLVHLIGKATMEDYQEPPYPDLSGLCTAFYKAMLAAGFQQGEGTHPSEIPPTPDTEWVLATGDTVYVYVRYEEGGETKMARATDWVIDPATGTVLPEDCFKFTGSVRVEHRETGDEMLLAEWRGFLMSVYPDRAAMIEVALASALKNNYGYNWSRLPKHDGSKPFYVDLIFSKTKLKK